MEFSRVKKTLAGVSLAALSLAMAGPVFAAYSDVPSGVWFEDAVDSFLDAGYLDATQPRFRPGDSANRAEFVKLIVELNGGILATPPAVASFDDTAPGAWYYGYFEEAAKEGWVRGDNSCYGSHPCYARPGSNINRAEAAALIVRAFGLESTGAAPDFVDNPSGQWYTDVIQTAADTCVLQGDDSTGRVRPGDSMNRAEMVTMLFRVDQNLVYGKDCGKSNVSKPVIQDAVATSTTTVEVEFNMPVDETAAEDASRYSVTNGEELDVVSAALVDTDLVELTLADPMESDAEYTLTVTDMETADGDQFSDSETFTGYTTIVKGEGVLELSVASGNPTGDTVPKGAQGVVMLSTDFTASCDDSVVIENLTVLHEGFGAVADITGLYAAIDGARVSRKRTIDSEDQTSDLRFSSPLVVDKCETVTVDVVADFSSTAVASAEHNLVVELPSDVTSNALEVTGNFPLRGETFRIAAVTSGIITVTYRSVNPTEVEVGDRGVVVGKFEVASDSTEDQTFYSMTLEQNSSTSDGDFTNIAIRRTDGTVLTNTVSQSVGDFLTLVFDPPFTVLEGDKITLEVVADIVGGAGDSIQMNFEESSDVFAVGSLYGYGVNGQLYGSQVAIATSPTASTVTIDAGEFTIGIQGPSTQNYTRDDNDAVLANVEFNTGGEPIDVKDFFILVQGQTSTGAALVNACSSSYDNIHEVLEDVELRNKTTGRTVDGVRLTGSADFGANTNSNTFQVYRFDDFIVRGDETMEFRVDFVDNGSANCPKSGNKFRIHICGEPTAISGDSSNDTGCSFGGVLASASTSYQMQVEGLTTGDSVLDVRPRGTITGNFQNIANATLTVTVSSLTTTRTAVKNADDINLLRFEARAGEAEDILFTKAVFEAASGSLANANNYALWVDTDGDSKVDTILEDGVASQTSQVTFSDLAGGGYVVPREETVIFEVHADVASALTNGELEIRFDTGASVTYLEAEELDDGSSLSGLQLNGAACAAGCDIVVTTRSSTLWALISQGDLYVTEYRTERSKQLLGGSTSEQVLSLKFDADFEDIEVTDLQLNSSGSTALSVDRLLLYKFGETTSFAEASRGGCGTDDDLTTNDGASTTAFCANMESKQLVVTDDKEVIVEVRPVVKTDAAGGTSGEDIQFFVDKTASADFSTTGSGAVRARGLESSNNLAANDADGVSDGEVVIGGTSLSTANARITGELNEVVMSKITSIANATGDPNGTAISANETELGAFQFTAASHANSQNGLNVATLSGVIFSLNAENVLIDASTFKFYNTETPGTTSNCTAVDDDSTRRSITANASGSFLVQCRQLTASSVDTEVEPGSSETFALKANITDTNTTANGASTLQVSIQDFSNIRKTTFETETDSGHVEWVDKDNSSTTAFTWIEYPDTVVKSTSYRG